VPAPLLADRYRDLRQYHATYGRPATTRVMAARWNVSVRAAHLTFLTLAAKGYLKQWHTQGLYVPWRDHVVVKLPGMPGLETS
jgi:hypothetical protein